MGGRFGEILLLFILVLLLFGPNKLPDMAKSIGQAMNEFKEGRQSRKPALPASNRTGRRETGLPSPS